MGLRVHGIICGFWFGIWASRTLKLIVLTSSPEESGGLMSLLIPVICHSRKARVRSQVSIRWARLGLWLGWLWLGCGWGWDC